MSVMLLNQESFLRNADGINKFSHKFNYGRMIHMEELKKTFNNLYHLNAKSWNNSYKDDAVEITDLNYRSVNITDEHQNILSLLKSLQCLSYQIEFEPTDKELIYKEHEALRFLHDIINQITSYLISEMEEYKTAKWC